MHAVRLLGRTEIEQIKPRVIERVAPAEGQILIKLVAAGLNPMDWESASGHSAWIDAFPHTLGNEGAGIIVALGKGVQGFQVGDVVLAYNFGASPGMLAEYNVVDAQNLALLPAGFDPGVWAASPIALLSVYHAFYKRGLLNTGTRILIEGSGGVGIFAIQWAKRLGYQVAALATGRSANWAKELGASHVFTSDMTKDALADGLKAAFPEGFDIIFSTLGGSAILRLASYLAKNGRFISTMPITALAGEEQVDTATLNAVSMSALFNQNSWEWFLAEPDGKSLALMLTEAQRLGINCPIAAEYPLSQTAEALCRAAAGANRGKIVVRMA